MGVRQRGTTPLVVAAVVAVLLAGCGGDERSSGRAADGADDADDAGRRRLRIVTTVSPITNLVANVAGGLARITGVVPEGADSHTFEPPPGVARLLARADVVYLNGLGLEEPVRHLAEANASGRADVVELGPLALAPAEYVFDASFPRRGGRPNPHAWTSPVVARRYAEVVAADLARRDPSRAAAYRGNLQRLVARLDQLADAVRRATATVPPERRRLLTYHDSFPYFARDFGWTVVGAIQPSDFDEPSPKDVAALIGQIRREGVPAIFGSEVFPSPVLEQIGREAGVRYVGSLRDDDLPGRPGDPEHSYLGLIRADVATMVAALGGDPSALRALDVSDVVPDGAEYAR